MIYIARKDVAALLNRTPSSISILAKKHSLGRMMGRERFFTLDEIEIIKRVTETKLQRLIKLGQDYLASHQPLTLTELAEALDQTYSVTKWVVVEWTFRDERLFEYDDKRLGYITGKLTPFHKIEESLYRRLFNG